MAWSQASEAVTTGEVTAAIAASALLKASNLSDLTDLVAARYNLGMNAFGNFLSVDAVNGDDLRASPGGFPYATVEAAVAAAVDGDVIWLFPGTYNLAAGITLPTGVALVGTSHRNAVIQMLLVTADTTLVTMGIRSSIENVTLKLTSAEHHTLCAVGFPTTTMSDASVEGCTIVVDNSTASDVGTSNVNGVHSYGTGVASETDHGVIRCVVTVESAGLGNKRGILSDTAAHHFHCSGCIVRVERTGVGAGSYIGIESNFAGVDLFFQGDWVTGDSSGISQTLGTINITPATYFTSANGKNFSTSTRPATIMWGDDGATPSGTRYMRFGTGASSSAEPKMTFRAKAVVKDLIIRAVTPPGGARTDTWTIRKNGVDTALTGSLSAAAVENTATTVSVDFAEGDVISLKMVGASSSGTTDVQVTVVYV